MMILHLEQGGNWEVAIFWQQIESQIEMKFQWRKKLMGKIKLRRMQQTENPTYRGIKRKLRGC
jgi:hypothetical protein